MLRTIPRTKFRDGQAVGWTFGVSAAFKSALDISPTARVLSDRGTLKKELINEGIQVPHGAEDGEPKAMADLYVRMQSAGLVVVNISEDSQHGKKRVVVVLETEGSPPTYKFSAGDIFYDPPEVHKMNWGDGLKILRRCIQILKLNGEKIQANLWTYQDSKASTPVVFSCSQTQLAIILKTGIMETSETV